MKTVFFIILISISALASATDYYVSSTGNDSINNGLSSSTPWKTISKVNSIFSTLKPGDRILFKRGDTFYGTLTISKSGTVVSPIIIGAYGTGESPILTGLTSLTLWSNEGNGIYSATLSGTSRLEVVIIDGRQYWMGQYPNTGFLTYESYNDNSSITDNELPSAPNWTGAEIFIRKDLYITTRATITSHTNQTLTYTEINGSSSTPNNNFGYIIQNDVKTLNDFGDWCYDSKGTKLYLYFGSSNPVNHIVKAATLQDLIYISSQSCITIENIHLLGCNHLGINCNRVNHLSINSCKVEYIGSEGLYLATEVSSSYVNIDHSEFRKINGNAVEIWANNVSFTNNIVDSIGLFRGACYGSNNGNGLYGRFDNSLIQYNEISNVAHNGIYPYGNYFLISNNFIHNTELGYLDAGAIYISHFGFHFSGQVLKNNIIIDAIGNNWGTNNWNSPWSGAEGIYLDSYNDSVSLYGNTVANCNQGIKLFESQGTIVKNNTSYNNVWQFCISNSDSKTPLHPLRNISMSNNIAFAKDATQEVLNFYTCDNDLNLFGISDSSYWARPMDDNNSFFTYTPATGSKYRTLIGWQSVSGQDVHSNKSPITIKDTKDIKFYYNTSKVDKVITLIQPMIDVKKTKYVNSVTLTPYTSIILMVDPNPAQPVVPTYSSSVIQNATPNVLEMTYNINLSNLSIPSPTAFTVINNIVSSVAITGNLVSLTLTNPVKFGDTITVSYTQPAAGKLQSLTGGLAVNLIPQPVTNNLLDPSVPNDPPVVVLIYPVTTYSGFVDTLDASGSYDPDNDLLTYTWTVPANIPVSDTTGPTIKFLSPVVTTSQMIDFGLNVSDGRITISKIIQVNLMPYKPELGIAKISNVEASSYYLSDYPINITDGNLGTKWSVNGDNQFLILSLADPFKISHLQIAFLPGQKFESYFDILASKDNSVWDPVLINIASCNFSGDLQTFDFPPGNSNTEYSFLKLVGHGNSIDTWNNYSELKIFGSIGKNLTGKTTKSENISIYPNPAHDLINILILEPPTEPQKLKIFDMTGSLRFEDQLDPGINNVQIPINLKSGVYIIQFLVGSSIIFVQKLIVME